MRETLIEEIEIYPVKPKRGLVAFASFVLDRKFSINSVAIYSRLDGSYRLVYPSKILPNSKQVNLIYPINREAGQEIERIVVKEFENLTKIFRKSNEKEPEPCPNQNPISRS